MSVDPSEWLDKYGDLLYRMALIRVRDGIAAEDLVQETLLAALQQKGAFRGQSSESTWLVGILKHKVTDYVRCLYRTPQPPDDQTSTILEDRGFLADGEWARGFFPADWGFDPHILMERAEFWAAFNQCLSLLPQRAASLFALYVMDGVSSDNLCNDFNINPTNLRVLLYRSRMQLRECLEKRWLGKGSTK